MTAAAPTQSLQYKEPKNMTPSELVERYEDDIRYGSSELGKRIWRSDARRQLKKVPRPVLLPLLVEHLHMARFRNIFGHRYGGYNPHLDPELEVAWRRLLIDVANADGLDRTALMAEAHMDFQALEGWVRQHIQQSAA